MKMNYGRGVERLSKEIRVPYDIVKGYYIIVNGEAHFLGSSRESAADVLDRDSGKYLNDRNGYNYSIDYCFGHDVDGRILWSDFDRSNDLM